MSKTHMLAELSSSPTSSQRYLNLHGSSDAYLLAQLTKNAKPLVIFCAHAVDAQRLVNEILYFSPELKVHLFPDWETLPYDTFSPHSDLVSERLATLYQITRRACDVVVVPVTTALYRLAPPAYLAAYTFFIKQNDKLASDELRAQLTLAGYNHVTQVLAPGEYSIRGGIIDLFPMGTNLPYRIELDDDIIETIRFFDVDTQRSIYKVTEIRLLPAREFPMDETGRALFRSKFRETFEGDPSKRTIYRDITNGTPSAGIEYYLPLFFNEIATFFDYLPQESACCLHGEVHISIEQFWKDTNSRYQMLRGDSMRPLLPPTELFLTIDAFFSKIEGFRRVEINNQVSSSSFLVSSSNLSAKPETRNQKLETEISKSFVTTKLPEISVDRRAEDPLYRFKSFLNNFSGRTLLLVNSPGRSVTVKEYLNEYGLHPQTCSGFEEFYRHDARLMLGISPLVAGFILPEQMLAVVTENELYAGVVRSQSVKDSTQKVSIEGMLRDLSELRVGDPVVHIQHGIGRYLGLVNINLGEGETEFLHLEYQGGDKLYVPVAQLQLISRYSGIDPESAPLHKLGSGQWEKAKKKAAQQVRDSAAELLNLYARRAAREGHAFLFKQHDLDAFAESFGFEETPDQAGAIQAVIQDMRQAKPMDRLICGDVGFGKTEVALRATFIALMDGKQVVVLTPTTLLAEQHFQTFSDRFAEWPVKIAELSRFRSKKEINKTLIDLKEGNIDLIIGTHRLLQKDVKFKRLGLVIIDEEHRFGVRQKEAFKTLRAEVDVLTLTATPIPRSLAMSLEGLRDFSVITTAPQKRLAIKTFVVPFNNGTIREAALRELKRGGQIYFLHNEVASIQLMLEKLQKLLPEARISIAHGQMRERELERVMRDFYQQRFNMLLCTTIIETGIDIPTANTILINRADKFGLAQLHQLRGRVGRSHHQAYAYLLLDEEAAISTQAKKRLEAIQMMEELGSGFFLAMHDLEIRGAGEVLGEAQSGEVQEIGLNLYTDMLNHAIVSLKQGKEPDLSQPLEITTEINLHMPALLPNTYCPDIHERLVLYKRLANCGTLDELDALHEELIDRFGLLPEAAQALLESHRLRILSKPLGVARMDASSESIQLQFVPNPPIDGSKIIQLIRKNKHYKMAGPDKLKVELSTPDLKQRIGAIKSLLKGLQE